MNSDARKHPLVSVVIPCFNQGRFLADAIDSVLAQEEVEAEIVVVDDGSTDDTAAVAARYPQVRYVYQSNRGLPAARNRGLAEASGSLLVFLDSDDCLTPAALRSGIRELEAHPEAAFTWGRFEKMDVQGRPIDTPQRRLVERDHYRELLEANIIPNPASVLYRREPLEAVGGFDENPKSSEDYDLYLRIARLYPIHAHATVVSRFRRHPTSMSTNTRRMLGVTVVLHRRQRRYTRGHRALAESWKKGRRGWQLLYGERLVTETYLHARERMWREVARDLRCLSWWYPRGLRMILLGLRKSNVVTFHVLPPGSTATEREEEAQAPSRGALAIVRLHPSTVRAGEGFNVQQDGRSALAVRCRNARPETIVVLDGTPLESSYNDPELVTAIVPDEFYAEPGTHDVFLLK